MIGRDYLSWGSKRHIFNQFGDNRGNPYQGPLLQILAFEPGKSSVQTEEEAKGDEVEIEGENQTRGNNVLSFKGNNIANEHSTHMLILNKQRIVSLHNLIGATEYNIYPRTRRFSTGEALTNRVLDDNIDTDDWQLQFLANDSNQIAQSRFKVKEATFEGVTLAMSCWHNKRLIAIADERPRISFFDLDSLSTVRSFGSSGDQPGEMLKPTAIACLSIGSQSLIIVGDSDTNQRISLYTEQGKFIVSMGGEGPLKGQFRDIPSIAVCPSDFTQAPPDTDVASFPYWPKWFKHTVPYDVLEDSLFDESLPSNFVLGRRESDPSLFDLLHISPSKSIVRSPLKYFPPKATEEPGFYFLNQVVGDKIVYPNFVDLVRKRRELVIREESRDSQCFAVVDRRNFRVQVIRYYWTDSFLFAPSLEVIDIVGGIHGRHCELHDPISVAYSPGGEMAVCDYARKVMILSPTLQLIKSINLNFVSLKDLNQGTLARKRNPLSPLEIEASKKPCCVSFGRDRSLAIGYASGGVYVFKPNKLLPVGALEKLDFASLAKIITDYLLYDDIVQLRNTCWFLHNFTRELRLSYQIFPYERRPLLNKILFTFTHRARVGTEGADNLSSYVFKDKLNKPICVCHLQLRCVVSNCPDSHSPVDYDRRDLELSGAYLTYDDFASFVNDTFSPQFYWKFEPHIKELFKSYSTEKTIFDRMDPMTRRNEFVRTKLPIETSVLTFKWFLEAILILEEHFSGLKHIMTQKLFKRSGGRRMISLTVPTNFESLEDKRAWVDLTAQYERGLEIPANTMNQSKRIITRNGYENAERKGPDAVREHVARFNAHSERAEAAIYKLFS